MVCKREHVTVNEAVTERFGLTRNGGDGEARDEQEVSRGHQLGGLCSDREPARGTGDTITRDKPEAKYDGTWALFVRVRI